MSDNYINKIKIGNNEYDIQASSIGDVSGINITNNTVGTESAVNFTAKGSDSPTTKQGKISLNSKGNQGNNNNNMNNNMNNQQQNNDNNPFSFI